MEIRHKEIHSELVIVGGGMPGICAAIQAARLGMNVILINDRGYLGGNASAEIDVTINGSEGVSEYNLHSRASGIIDELLIERLYRTPEGNPYLWDAVLNDYMIREGIAVYSNTYIDAAQVNAENRIVSVTGSQNTTETRFTFYGDLFIDDTGDGVLGYLSDAEYRLGRESRYEFDESIAPEKADHCVIPSTLTFYASDTGSPVRYVPPGFAVDLTKGDVLQNREIPRKNFWRFQWYYEIGDEDLDQVYDGQEIITKHRELVYGIWDYIKNSGRYPEAKNYDLMYVASKPGKREGRRLVGQHLLEQKDITEQIDFDDTVAHGGWSIDLHAIAGFFSKDFYNAHYCLRGIYQIPIRCCISKNIRNLMMAGRCMSTTHVAFGSTRVIATLATVGQAVGAAAWLCKQYSILPTDLYQQGHHKKLQQILLKHDQWVPGVKSEDPLDMDLEAHIDVSSVRPCEVSRMDKEIRLDRAVALSVPAAGHIRSLDIPIKVDQPTSLTYRVYRSSKRENYDPAHLLVEKQLELEPGPGPGKDYVWTTFPVEIRTESTNLLFEFSENVHVATALSEFSLSGTATLIRNENHYHGMIDVYSHEVMKYFWTAISDSLCFKLNGDFDLFAGKNLNNGFARPFAHPNLWMSDRKVDGEFIRIRFPSPREIRELWMRFDPDYEYRNLSLRGQPSPVIPKIVKEYEIYTLQDHGYELHSRVTGNYKRVNIIDMEKKTTSEIKIVFRETNGYESVSVYEVRVY
jgi:hypothetical protein